MRTARSRATSARAAAEPEEQPARSGMRPTSATRGRAGECVPFFGRFPRSPTSRPRASRGSRARPCCRTFRSGLHGRPRLPRAHPWRHWSTFPATIRSRTRALPRAHRGARAPLHRRNTCGRTSASSGRARRRSLPALTRWNSELAISRRATGPPALGSCCCRLFEPLPFPLLVWLGTALGGVAARLPMPFVRIARRNLELCLPELDAARNASACCRALSQPRHRALRNGDRWWSSDAAHSRGSPTLEGDEHLQSALARGHGRDPAQRALHHARDRRARVCARMPTNIMYRPTQQCSARRLPDAQPRPPREARHSARRHPHADRRARANEPVWYAPDQSYRKKGAEMVPFFGIPAATNTATSRLAQMTGAAVLPYFPERLPGIAGLSHGHPSAAREFPGGRSAWRTPRASMH